MNRQNSALRDVNVNGGLLDVSSVEAIENVLNECGTFRIKNHVMYCFPKRTIDGYENKAYSLMILGSKENGYRWQLNQMGKSLDNTISECIENNDAHISGIADEAFKMLGECPICNGKLYNYFTSELHDISVCGKSQEAKVSTSESTQAIANKNEWLPFSEALLDKLDSKTIMSIDTRDFCAIVVPKSDLEDKYDNQIANARKNKKSKLFTKSQAVEALLLMKSTSGGDCEWRHLNLDGVSDNSGWNLKYIKIINLDNAFLIMTTNGSIISRVAMDTIDYSRTHVL